MICAIWLLSDKVQHFSLLVLLQKVAKNMLCWKKGGDPVDAAIRNAEKQKQREKDRINKQIDKGLSI